MARVLPRLRRGLDVMSSPMKEHPGLFIRDPFRYSQALLLLPPPLVPCLILFDGRHDEGDLRSLLVRLTGELEVTPLVDHLQMVLSTAGFLEDAAFEEMRTTRVREFVEAPDRAAAHVGSGYPEDATALRETLDRYLADGQPGGELAFAELPGPPLGIAAPHVSPEGGWRCYGSAYRRLAGVGPDRTFVVLGTSHYGEPSRFGLTRKPFVSPLGRTSPDPSLVDRLVKDGGPAVCLEDYCHAVEHSIEFQVVFLQHLFGPEVRVVPILCGPLGPEGGSPRDDDGVRTFLELLRDVTSARSDVTWVLGIDMAHVGKRYRDPAPARPNEGAMLQVEAFDRERLELASAGDAEGFWAKVGSDDPLKWCGSSPLYTFLSAAGPVRGSLLRYEQWAIDEDSVVSFAALSFHR
ncbi:MAG TPA: AmmeMemoRadiSam system protein B [Vicinamibacteria bacterium]|nr:AmmeMemoRadiSam system protein B [Vicinamibacteria bacterium]